MGSQPVVWRNVWYDVQLAAVMLGGHADAAFWRRLTGAGYRFFDVPELTDVRRYHPGSVTAAGIPA